MLGEVVADQHVEHGVAAQCASASSAAATRRGAEVESAATARISAGASGWSPIRRWRRAVLSSGTTTPCAVTLTKR
jgi:hypothetical protein